MEQAEQKTIFEMVGGQEAFERLVGHFYDAVEQDAILRPLYPDDMDEARQKLALFLAQFFGGPELYSQLRGHPRLRARHLQFPIGRRERDAWLKQMFAALDAAGIEEPALSHMRGYFQEAATFLINQ